MTISPSLAEALFLFLLAQTLAGVLYLFKASSDAKVGAANWEAKFLAQEKAQAAQDRVLAEILELLKEHNPVRIHGEMVAMQKQVDDLEKQAANHHKWLRYFQKRLDQASIPDIPFNHDDA